MHKQLLLALNLFVTLASCDFQPPILDNFGSKDERLKAEKQQKFPPCKSCSMFTESFRKVNSIKINYQFNLYLIKRPSRFSQGFEKTLRGKHEGGDAHWEEKNLGRYKTSELRLIEIQETLCHDVSRGEQQCHSIAEDHEAEIEEWWKMQDEFPDFFKWFCIDTLKVCCPINHYGKDCLPCKDCSKNGVCKGNGTRKGNGHCNCDRGYTGENCNECANGFYESFKDETKLLCSQCHTSCQNSCKGPGARNCQKCKEGWFQRDNEGCYDVRTHLNDDIPKK